MAVELSVEAAPWVPLHEVRLLADGEVLRRYRGSDLVRDDGVRLHATEQFTFDHDVFLTLEAGAPLAAKRDSWLAEHGGIYSGVLAPNFIPTAFTNPVFVDVDGNGVFDPVGLPLAAAATATPARFAAIWVMVAVGLPLWRRRRSVGRGAAIRGRASG